MVQYARLEMKSADIATDFGLEWATKLFGQEVIDQLPRYVRGPKTGKIKAYVYWMNCTVGGWSHGWGVMKPGKAGRAVIAPWCAQNENAALRGKLAVGDQNQPFCLSNVYLFEEGRARMAREKAAFAAVVEAERAEDLAGR